jgi:hypothetical protein
MLTPTSRHSTHDGAGYAIKINSFQTPFLSKVGRDHELKPKKIFVPRQSAGR